MQTGSPSYLINSMARPSQGSDGVAVNQESSTSNRGASISSSSSSSSSAGEMNSLTWGRLSRELIRVGALWLVGFKEACQLHRAVFFCKRSRPVLIKTAQCFLFNGCLFLGSILTLQRVIVPILRWFVGPPMQLPEENGDGRTAGVLQTVVVGVCYVFWLYPLYIISFVVNIIWYNDIAKHAFQAMDKAGGNSKKAPVERRPTAGKGSASAKGPSGNSSNGGIQSSVLQIGEQIYSVIMVSVFFVEVFAVSYIPYMGPVLNFVLLSWLYAYYCFDYKWSFAKWSLERRLLFFETNWAFFAGFGSPCVLATFFLSPLVSAGVMNTLFPLFVLVATACNPEQAVLKFTGSRDSTSTMRRLPIFLLANYVTVPLLGLLQPAASSMPSTIQSRKQG